MPSAKIAALENAPPTKRSYNPNKLSEDEFFMLSDNRTASTPGVVKCDPNLTINKRAKVYKIRCLSSWILKIFLNVSVNFDIGFLCYTLVMVPPAASIFC